MNRMHSGQLFSLLLLSGSWSVFCLPPVSGGGQLTGTAAGCAVQLFLCCILLAALKRGFSPLRLAQRHRWIAALYVLYFLGCTAAGFRQLWDAAPAQLLPASGKLTAIVLIALTCLYMVSAGQQALARSAPFVLGLLLISVLLLVIGAWKHMDPCLLPRSSAGTGRNMFLYLSRSAELGLLAVTAEQVREHRNAAVFGYLISKACLWGTITFLCLTAGGRLTAMQQHPFFYLAALSQPLQGQRADALYILVFVMVFAVYTAAQLTAAVTVLRYTQKHQEVSE